MSTAAVFLIVAALAAIGGSLVLWLGYRLRQPRPPDFNEQLRAIAPDGGNRSTAQPSGIVHLDTGSDADRSVEKELNPGT